jgi:hypothetical protein
MALLRLALEKNGPKRIEIAWRGFHKDVVVRFDGTEVGRFENRRALKEGKAFPLPDGSTLKVRLQKAALKPDFLEVLRNDAPLPGSASDPSAVLGLANGMIAFVAAVNVVLGLVGCFVESDVLRGLGAGLGMVIEGLIYAVLAAWLRLRHSVIALGLAVGLFIVDSILVVVAHAPTNPAALVTRFFILVPMCGGFSALRQLRHQAKLRPA